VINSRNAVTERVRLACRTHADSQLVAKLVREATSGEERLRR